MTDLWNTLWGFWDAGKVDPFALETCFPDFIKKIRAEGDRLKEELETAEAQINLLKIDVEALDKENKILQSIGETQA